MICRVTCIITLLAQRIMCYRNVLPKLIYLWLLMESAEIGGLLMHQHASGNVSSQHAVMGICLWGLIQMACTSSPVSVLTAQTLNALGHAMESMLQVCSCGLHVHFPQKLTCCKLHELCYYDLDTMQVLGDTDQTRINSNVMKNGRSIILLRSTWQRGSASRGLA